MRKVTEPGCLSTLAIFTFMVVIVGIIFAISATMDNHSRHVSCLRLHEVTGLETRYVRSGIDGECYVNLDGHWIPEERWREIP